MQKLIILGSTGSIGTQTLEVVEHLNDNYKDNNKWKVVGLAANSNIELLEKQARRFHPDYLAVMNESLAKELEYRVSDMDLKVISGQSGLQFLSGEVQCDFLVNAIVGAAGLKPTLNALEAGWKLGLANKESLVIGGKFIKKYLDEEKLRLLPIDSEHNAVFQLLEDKKEKEVDNIILTASGGPFYDLPQEKFSEITVEEALNHPNWDMGGKITIDSATLMNKGLEVIEAHWLFQYSYDKIRVIIHPESIIHSMIELVDGVVLAEMGSADMKIPIQYVLTYPEKFETDSDKLNFFETGQLNFVEPDLDKFPALKYAYQAGEMGGSMPVVLNAANEEAVSSFLNNEISFNKITEVIFDVMQKHDFLGTPSLEDVFNVDKWARCTARDIIKGE